jgi:hypothetical protein
MTSPKLIDWPYVIGLMLLPVVLVAVLLLAGKLQRIGRYDPVYFSPEYQDRYDTPGAVLTDVEAALNDGDRQLMNELLATRKGARPLTARPQVGFVFMAGEQGEYLEYLFLDRQNYSRVVQYVREEGGRYIAAEADLYFYMDSGRWLAVAVPLAASWWILVLLFTGGVYLYRRLAVARLAMWGGRG